VILTISLSRYEASVAVWVERLRAAVATIRQVHPQVRHIVLQPIVGGPNHQLCPIPQDLIRGVRAAFNHPPIDLAIAQVLPDAPDLIAGPSPEVASCADYSDQAGHFVNGARGYIATAIGLAYTLLPPPPSATTTTSSSVPGASTSTTISSAPSTSTTTSTLADPSSTSTSSTTTTAPPPTSSTSTSTVPPVPVEMVFVSLGAEDGAVTESTETSDVGANVAVASDDLQVGDHLGDRQVKGIVSFDTSALPDGAPILGAVVRLRRVGVWGGNPFATLGAARLDIQRGAFGSDPVLQASDFQAVATAAAAGVLPDAPTNGTWASGALTSAGLAAIDPTGRTQVRIAFPLDDNDNGLVDRVRYGAGEHPDAASRPELRVTILP
jgi:hypothetical protein